MRYLTISKCPTHDFWAVSIDDEGCGTRLTPAKCCGHWEVVKQFKMTAQQLRDAVIELECAAEQMEWLERVDQLEKS